RAAAEAALEPRGSAVATLAAAALPARDRATAACTRLGAVAAGLRATAAGLRATAGRRRAAGRTAARSGRVAAGGRLGGAELAERLARQLAGALVARGIGDDTLEHGDGRWISQRAEPFDRDVTDDVE